MPAPVEQELVLHVFAPRRGERAEEAAAGLGALWRRCQELLGVTEPVPLVGLPTEPPRDLVELSDLRGGPGLLDLRDGGEGPLAAAQNPAVDAQAVLRVTGTVLNLSLIMAVPGVPGLAAAVPPGWVEFDRWCDELDGGDTAAAYGAVRVYQAKLPAEEVRESLPERLRDVVTWQRRGRLLLWEPPGGVGRARDVVVIAPEGADAELTAWTWSRGGPEPPPLARYLLQASLLRHHVRVWRRDESWLADLRDRVRGHLVDLGESAARAGELRRDEIGLRVAADRVERMRASVLASEANMVALLGEVLPADRGLAGWFLGVLDGELDGLLRGGALAREVREAAREQVGAEASPTSAPPSGEGRQLRMGFAVDVVGYSARTTPEQERVQRRVAEIVEGVLAGLAVRMSEADHQGTGDGLMVFLPPRVDVQWALPLLLLGAAGRLADDNAAYRDRVRLRMAVDVGPVGLAALGFGGKAATSVGRMLDSEPLRAAVRDNQGADLVVAVSERLHDYVIGEGAPGVDPEGFTAAEFDVKGFRGREWLWVDQGRDPL
ncbi:MULTISPECIES: CATRA conflict system CASPASE/TPR repeat-associated protein [Actinosynnema]|uniref:CATRA conflict system CASPASE/TPR repeat-associated protein n=1 Tax=Actinosynnema TaxID=40566 RepID=UPI0020A2C7C3|nr:CATRA conflict system CASPASE/TPR repeat-associated protein [Actinosynnema pretiosum]MCP2096624.1 hypothetical protein [Actinosynnema pretiosum]